MKGCKWQGEEAAQLLPAAAAARRRVLCGERARRVRGEDDGRDHERQGACARVAILSALFLSVREVIYWRPGDADGIQFVGSRVPGPVEPCVYVPGYA